MNTRRRTPIFVFAAAALGSLALPGASCGGKVTVGYIDDSGIYYTPDGALVPSSACQTWDASHAADPPPVCSEIDQPDAGCGEWVSASDPPTFPVGGAVCYQVDGGSIACTKVWAPTDGWPQCAKFAFDDPFCSAWIQQFVIGHKAIGNCRVGDLPNFAGVGLLCGTGHWNGYNCPPGMISVEPDSGDMPDCVLPCTP